MSGSLLLAGMISTANMHTMANFSSEELINMPVNRDVVLIAINACAFINPSYAGGVMQRYVPIGPEVAANFAIVQVHSSMSRAVLHVFVRTFGEGDSNHL